MNSLCRGKFRRAKSGSVDSDWSACFTGFERALEESNGVRTRPAQQRRATLQSEWRPCYVIAARCTHPGSIAGGEASGKSMLTGAGGVQRQDLSSVCRNFSRRKKITLRSCRALEAIMRHDWNRVHANPKSRLQLGAASLDRDIRNTKFARGAKPCLASLLEANRSKFFCISVTSGKNAFRFRARNRSW